MIILSPLFRLKIKRNMLEAAIVSYACIMTMLAMGPRQCHQQKEELAARLMRETPRQLTEELIIPIAQQGENDHVERFKRTAFQI